MDIEIRLYDELEHLYTKLQTLEPGTDEHKVVLDEATKLTDRAIELHKIESEREDRAAARENEQAADQRKLIDERVDRIVRNVISVFGIVLPVIVTVWGTKISLKFEETGTVTTQAGRSFIQRIFKK